MYPVQRQRFPARPLRISGSVGFGFLSSRSDGGHHHSRRADAALRAAAFDECLLHSVKLTFATAMPSIVLIVAAFDLRHRHQTTVDDLAVDEHGARATLAFAASFLRAGQMSCSRSTSSRRSIGIGMECPVLPVTVQLISICVVERIPLNECTRACYPWSH